MHDMVMRCQSIDTIAKSSDKTTAEDAVKLALIMNDFQRGDKGKS